MPVNTALISGIFALTGAIIGQIINNKLTIKRDQDKYNKESYQELYSPILNDLYAVVDISLHFRKGHDTNIETHEEDYWDNILYIVETKLKYAGSNVVSAYQELIKYNYIEDYTGFTKEIKRVKLARILLDEIHDLVLNTGIMDSEQLNKINYYRNIYLLWENIFDYLGDRNLSEMVMKYHWIYDSEKLSASFYENIKMRFDLVRKEYFPNIFYELISEIVNEECLDIFESQVMIILNGDEEILQEYYQYENFDMVFMSKRKRNQFLKEIYGCKVYTGKNFLIPLDKKEARFYKEVIQYWLEKGFIIKREKLSRVVIIITAVGIDYVEKEL